MNRFFKIVANPVFDQWLPQIDEESGIRPIPVWYSLFQALKNVISGREDKMS